MISLSMSPNRGGAMSRNPFGAGSLIGRGAAQPTRHGQRRQAERCVPQFIIDALIDFGEERFLGGECRSYSFTKATWKKYACYMGPAIAGLERYRSVYLVVAGDNSMITVAWRH